MNEATLHDLLSGRRKDIGAKLLRGSLHAAECGYSLVMSLRNLSYDQGWRRRYRVSAPVISVGNITTGGTGKTPVAAWLANWLRAKGWNPGLISRGYRSLVQTSEGTSNQVSPENDEKLVLDRLCPDVPHLQQRDRVTSAQRAIREFGCDVLLLDDGFQHRRLHRDLDLVLIDALKPWGYGHVLPRGLLRESLTGLNRADLILITRSNQCSADQRQELISQLRRYRAEEEYVEVAFKPIRFVDLNWQNVPLAEVESKKVVAFCGIGNPDGFRQTVASSGANLLKLEAYPDHHHYRDEDLSYLAEIARTLGADRVVTTQKDLVKIRPDQWLGPPLLAIEIGLAFLNGEVILTSRLDQLMNRATNIVKNE